MQKSRWLYFFLVAGIVLSIAFFVLRLQKYYRVQAGFVSNRLPSASNRQLSQKEIRYKPKSDSKNISHYEKLFKKKNLFKVLGKAKAPLPKKETKTNITLQQELAKFELLGIVSSAGKSQALIKNIESGKTFYCTGGERLNGFIIKEVLDDKVILGQEDWTSELRL